MRYLFSLLLAAAVLLAEPVSGQWQGLPPGPETAELKLVAAGPNYLELRVHLNPKYSWAEVVCQQVENPAAWTRDTARDGGHVFFTRAYAGEDFRPGHRYYFLVLAHRARADSADSLAEAVGPFEFRTVPLVTGVESRESAGIPEDFVLGQNYPNPFNPSTVIRFGLPEQANVTVKVYNLLGQRVRTLVSGPLAAGYHTLTWDGRDTTGRPASSGIYLLRMEASDFVAARRMLLKK